MATPVKGKFAKATGTTGTALPGKNWEMNDDAKPADWSNFRDGRKKVATLNDGDLKVELVLDEDATPESVGLTAGAAFTFYLYVNNAMTKAHIFPSVISKIGVSNKGLEDVVMYNVDATLNGTVNYNVSV